ncbi:uncharacterized protein [Physcomitrium patens]|uniref:Uncharacterized protein n=1 Tax=Physcomitrium patens TaxID=3218 RepID=A0A2K1IYQ9_PHYPA|nr:RNA polymerase-associated protein LEO1-like [Physcomitrium patens]XP_024404019.1 RNA polymerase-associated protein LEO1-like [Physcomitrium patens]PNR34412.1 hypothetical protein PHYPA_024229 [Physcomitrium patens]|eukprot:XP_024404018.1 RNA polymerase-associated protein LEO1-like [Physcomitrella patens]
METERRLGSGRKQGLSTQRGVVIGVATVVGLSLVSKIISVLKGGKSEKSNGEQLKSLEAPLNGNDASKSSPPMQAVVESDDKSTTLDSSEPTTVVKDEDVKSLEAVMNSPPQPPTQGVAALPSPEELFNEVGKEQKDIQSSLNAGDLSVTVVEQVVENGETVSSKTTHTVEDQLKGSDNVDNGLESTTELEGIPLLNGEDAGKQVTEDGEKHSTVNDAGKTLAEDEQRRPNAEVAEKHHTDDEQSQVEDVETHSKVEDVEKPKTEDAEEHETGDADQHLVEDGEKHSMIKEEEKHSYAEDAEKHSEVKEDEKHSNAEDGVKLETDDAGKLHIDVEEISSTGEDRSNTGDEEKDHIKDDAKHQSEDREELFRAEGGATEHSVEEEKDPKSETEVKFTTERDEKDAVEDGVENDTEVSKEHETETEEKASL